MAISYLRIMEKTSAFKDLQTFGMNFMNAFNTVETTSNDVKQISRNFTMIVIQADHLVQPASQLLEECGCEIMI